MENQEQTLLAYTGEQGFVVAEKFRFQETADQKRRKRFMEMVEFAKKRPDITAIVGYRVDRLTRNYRDHVLLDDLRLGYGKELHFVHDRLVVGPKSVGREISEWDTKVYLAKQHINRLKEDARCTINFKISQGEWPGKATYGYRNCRVNERSSIAPFEAESIAVTTSYELYDSGAYSMDGVRAYLKEHLGISLSKGKLDHILSNPFYAGVMRFEGELRPHVYEPLITMELFDRVQVRKKSFRKVPRKFAGLPFSYRGLVLCPECGCCISPEQKNKRGKRYVYYRCTQYFGKHGAPYVSEQLMDEQFAELFDRLTIPPDVAESIASTVSSDRAIVSSRLEAGKAALAAEEGRLKKRLSVLYDDRLDALISVETYLARKKDMETRVLEIEREVGNLTPAEDTYLRSVEALMRLCKVAGQAFRKAEVSERHSLVAMVIQNCKLEGKRLLWELKEPFKTVFSCSDRQIWLPLSDTFRNRTVKFDLSIEELESVACAV